MKLKKFKERDNKRIGIIVFTLVCILLVSGVILYRTFAIFEVKTTQNVIKGTVQDPGNLYFAFYVDNEIQKEMPKKGSEYVLDEEASYCGVTGLNDDAITVSLTENYTILVHGVTTSRTKCNLYFVKGKFIQGKGIPIVEKDDGLYEVNHADSTLEDGWKNTEYRFAGKDPKNYIEFNGELWRIIGLVNVKTNDGIEQRLKIISNNSIGDYSWDTSETNINEGGGINEWSQSDLMKLLNPGYNQETYGGSLYWDGKSGSCYNNQNNVTGECNFLNKGLTNSENYIANDIMWNTGALEDTAITADASYLSERSENKGNACNNGGSWCNDKVDRNSLWKGTDEKLALIGLPYPSDVGYSIGQNASGQCSNSSLLNQFMNCSSYSWYPITQFWTIIPNKNNSTNRNVFAFSSLNLATATAKDAKGVMPTLYLKTNVKIINDEQDGSKSKPYHLQQIL